VSPGLTLRQLEALKLLGEGYTNKEIARALAISERTAKAHVRAVFEALGVDNRTQAVVAAQRAGWLRTPRGAA
jgi:DNA-binding NarL/FixJ family response regulator